jgi:P27 family predicted phage terminase small subunit
MGSRGPAAKPNAVRVMEGKSPRKDELKAPPGLPSAPGYLDSFARAEWRRIVPLLHAMEILTKVDRAALEAYCNAYSNMREAQMVLAKKGLTVRTGPQGYLQQRPEVAIANKSMALVQKLCAEFGMTPSARARMAMPGGEKSTGSEGMDGLLSQPVAPNGPFEVIGDEEEKEISESSDSDLLESVQMTMIDHPDEHLSFRKPGKA